MDDEVILLTDGQMPPKEKMECKWVNVRGRQEHEQLLSDHKRCKELGLDIVYERTVYLKRWGCWLNGNNPGQAED